MALKPFFPFDIPTLLNASTNSHPLQHSKQSYSMTFAKGHADLISSESQHFYSKSARFELSYDCRRYLHIFNLIWWEDVMFELRKQPWKYVYGRGSWALGGAFVCGLLAIMTQIPRSKWVITIYFGSGFVWLLFRLDFRSQLILFVEDTLAWQLCSPHSSWVFTLYCIAVQTDICITEW